MNDGNCLAMGKDASHNFVEAARDFRLLTDQSKSILDIVLRPVKVFHNILLRQLDIFDFRPI
jgi:hypothetical protein